MNNNSFTTDTDVRYAQFQFFKPLLFVGIFLSLLACLGFLIAWQTFVFFESIVIVVCLVGYLSGKGKSDWNLHFDNDVLTLTNNANGQTYSVAEREPNQVGFDEQISPIPASFPLDILPICPAGKAFGLE